MSNKNSIVPKVIHEDNHLIVVDKPPLLATMGVSADEQSLVTWTKDWLRAKYDKPGNVYLGVVSRLDAFTSGLVVLAKTSKAAARLTKMFQSGEVKKIYTAILEGRMDPPPADSNDEFTVVDWVRKNDQRRRMEVVEEGSPESKRAELRYRVVGVSGQLTLLRVQLITGRKHQIRVQFAEMGMPVFGDRKYGAKQEFAPGIALQSTFLSFEHPVKRVELNFQIEPPQHWKLSRFGGE